MRISDIDARRKAADIDQKVLCQRAGVNASTYSQLKKGHRGAYDVTLVKLQGALDALVLEKEQGHG